MSNASNVVARGVSITVACVAAVAVLASLTIPASAQDSGFYGSLKGGLSNLEDMSFSDPATADLDLDMGSGWALSGAAGYRFGGGLRTEVEFGLSDAGVKGRLQENVQVFVPCGEVPSTPCLDPQVEGDFDGTSGMFMAFYDLQTGSAITPYLGAGLGFYDMSFDVEGRGRLNNGTVSDFDVLDDSDTVFAYRLAAGVAYDAGAFDLTADYTYTRTDRPSLDGQGAYIPFQFDRRVNSHQFMVGARYNF